MKQFWKLCLPALLAALLLLSACAAETPAATAPADTAETPVTAAPADTAETPVTAAPAETVQEGADDALWKDALYKEDTSFGTGAKKIEVKVEAGGKSVTFTVNTDKENLADALLEYKLVEGEDSQYGLYIKKVNGISADYTADGYWWSLNQNGAALMTGASDTAVSGGEQFELVRTNA